jgi:general secretion pathway protein J
MISFHKPPRIHHESGFTLLELLVAITLMAMLAVGIWAVLSISIRSWNRGADAIDASQRQRSTLDMVQKQIASMYPLYAPSGIDGAVQPSVIFSGTENSLRFVSLNSLQLFDDSGLMLVSYEMDQNAEGKPFLAEKEMRYTGQSLDQSGLGNSKSISVFDGLLNCNFEYYDPGDADNPAQWVATWDGSALNRLPAAVRMTMIAQDSQAGTLNRQLVVPLHAQASLLGALSPMFNNLRGPVDRD